jgi:hypothetical protein
MSLKKPATCAALVVVVWCVVLSAAGFDAESGKPPLPAAWEGKWVADPFADAIALEVSHGADGPGRPRVYRIEDPGAVAALLKEAKVLAVHNGIAAGLIPSASLTIRRKDGTSFDVSVNDDKCLACRRGFVYVSTDFIRALNRRLSQQQKEAIDILQRLPAQPDPNAPQPAPVVKPSLRSLTSGFAEMEVSYLVDGRMHRTRIKDAKTVDALHKKLSVVKQEPVRKVGPQSRTLTLVCKDGSRFYAQIVSAEEFFDFDAGWFTVLPAFMSAVNEEVSRREGRHIDILADNKLTEEQAKRAKELRNLLGNVQAIRFKVERSRGETVVVDQPNDVAKLMKALQWLEIPARQTKLERKETLAELSLGDGRKLEVRRLETGTNHEHLEAAPPLGDLVEISGFGQVWLDNQWKSRLDFHYYEKQREAEDRAAEETVRLVCQDWPIFLKHVLNVVAHYGEGDSQLTGCLTHDESRPILAALAAGKLEPLDWTAERWRMELEQLLARKAGSLDLTPGLGFYLMMVARSDKEFLVPPYGRLVFSESPLGALHKAIDQTKPNSVRLVPRDKE